MIYILMYLTAAVLANLSTSFLGAYASIINAFLFIGLDLTARDKLHDAWRGKGLFWKMLLLIATGSGISYLLNKDAGAIALASLVAFVVAGAVDTLVYQYLHDKAWMWKVNGSNIFSALADSMIFPTIAFGGIMPLIMLGQFAAKVSGGFIWSWIISKVSKK